MDLLRMLLSRCTTLFRTRVLDKDLEDELRSHIEFAVTEKMESGLSEREARREALKEFGGVTQVSEGYRAQRGLPFFAVLAQDLRSALRQLRKAPGFAWTAILTLALGIGATAAMFSVIDAVVLRPLPYRDAERIVLVKTQSASSFWQWSSWPGYLDMRRLSTSFDALAGYVDFWGMTLRTGDRAQYMNVVQGSDNLQCLRCEAAAGGALIWQAKTSREEITCWFSAMRCGGSSSMAMAALSERQSISMAVLM